MGTPAVRFVRTPTALADRHVGLEWEPHPSTLPVTWAEAVLSATDRGWRLPSASELIGFLGDCPAGAEWLPASGETFWSVTSSPFARSERVRAVSRDPDGRYVVVLLDKDDRARCWGVRRSDLGDRPWSRG